MIPRSVFVISFVFTTSNMSSSDDLSNSNSLMPTKMATCCERKAVFVTIYVEKPSRRASSNRHHCLHKSIKQELIGHKHGGPDKGYNRRTELLYYSRHLRESARSSTSAAIQSKPVSSIDHRQPSHKSEVMAVHRKATDSRSGACFDIWRIVVPSLFRSLTNHQDKKTEKKNNGGTGSSNNKIKAVMKRPPVMQKKWSFFSKPISMLHKKENR